MSYPGHLGNVSEASELEFPPKAAGEETLSYLSMGVSVTHTIWDKALKTIKIYILNFCSYLSHFIDNERELYSLVQGHSQ